MNTSGVVCEVSLHMKTTLKYILKIFFETKKGWFYFLYYLIQIFLKLGACL